MGCSGGSWGVLIEKLDERMRECSRSGGDCNIKFAFPVKLDRGSPIQGFGLKKECGFSSQRSKLFGTTLGVGNGNLRLIGRQESSEFELFSSVWV